MKHNYEFFNWFDRHYDFSFDYIHNQTHQFGIGFALQIKIVIIKDITKTVFMA